MSPVYRGMWSRAVRTKGLFKVFLKTRIKFIEERSKQLPNFQRSLAIEINKNLKLSSNFATLLDPSVHSFLSNQPQFQDLLGSSYPQ